MNGKTLRIESCLVLFATLVCLVALAHPTFAQDGTEQQTSSSEKKQRPKVVLTEEAMAIHRKAILFDGHNDLPYSVRGKVDDGFKAFDISKPKPDMHTDIPRLIKGGLGAQFWSAYVPASTRQRGVALQTTLEQIELIHAMHRRYPDIFEMAKTADDVERIRAKGKIAGMIGIEGGHSIENSLSVLGQLYELGARYMTLTHGQTLDWADSATDKNRPKNGGLTEFGRDVVKEMNRLGMLVDISHVTPETMRDALETTRAPVIASHSSAYAVCPHPRNVPDDVLKLVQENRGVIMVNFYSGFIVSTSAEEQARRVAEYNELRQKYMDDREYRQALRRWQEQNPSPAGTIHDVVDHIEHIIKTASIDNVGIGSDYDGIGQLPEQLEDVSTYPLITQELLNRGYNEEQILKILGGNVIRVLREAERVAAEMQAGR
ncbi:MAG: dipeptidase [Pirellulales bacterium]|nr:dipeptidase [Pirellulales bacterium]